MFSNCDQIVRILLVHQNFPGQFRQLLSCLDEQGHDLRAICSHQRPVPEGVLTQRYPPPDEESTRSAIFGLHYWAEGLTRAPQVARIVSHWRQQGWSPDLILGHTGWGETLLLHKVCPSTPQVLWPELWVKAEHLAILDPPNGPGLSLEQQADHMARNQLTKAALEHASAWVLPTRYQAESFPSALQSERLNIIHEGIDTTVACPRPDVNYTVKDILIDRNSPTITFVNRNLESLRGFDQFMRALPKIMQEHSSVRVLIVGGNAAGYAGGEMAGQTIKQRILEEVGLHLDLERVHFLGRVPYPIYIALLQSSWVHIYLSKPFILGWSLLEAMACGCCIVGSEGMPVSEAIQHRHNGWLVPLSSPEALSGAVLDLLANASLRQKLGVQACLDAQLWDQKVMWPKFRDLFESLASDSTFKNSRSS